VRRAGSGPARPGSPRWFRRYRWLILAGWLLVLMVVGWVLFVRSDKAPVAPLPGGPAAERSARQPPGRQDATRQAAGRRCHARKPYRVVVLQRPSADRIRREAIPFTLPSFLRKGSFTHTAFHGSLLDHQNEKLYTEQARTAGNPSDGRRDGFDFSFGDWRLQGVGAQHKARMAGKDFSLDLQMSDNRTRRCCTRPRELRLPVCSISERRARAITPRVRG
jgi:hypothetical protein